MARILLASTPEKGHVNPLAGVAQQLRERGHHTGWLAIPEGSSQMKGLADEVLEPLAKEPRPEFVTSGPDLARLVRDPEALKGWIRGLLLDPVSSQIDPVRRAIHDFAPNVIVSDPMLYQVILAAHLERVPFGVVSSSLNPVTPEDLDVAHLRNIRSHAPARDQLFESLGLAPRFRVCDFLASSFTAVFSTPEYVGGVEVPDGVRLVGPSIPLRQRGDEADFPWDRLSRAKPVVYLSFGSQISYQPEIFHKVAEAALPLGVQLVISAGDLSGTVFPGDVIAVGYAPQLELLPKVSFMITHGGANSVMEALYFGVPLLISPVCNDQPLQAFFLEKSGAGLCLDLYEATTSETRTAMERLLARRSSVRDSALRIRESYRASNGAAGVVNLVEGLLTREKGS